MSHLAEYQKNRSAEARKKLMDFIADNPLFNARECARALNMNYDTVTRYIRDAKREKVKK